MVTTTGSETTDESIEAELWTVTGDEFPGGTVRERLEFLNNAPMPPLLCNQLITDFHGDMAELLAQKIYANAAQLPMSGPSPTFSVYAHFASASVGSQLQVRIPSGRRRRARALIDGNRDVAYTVGAAAIDFLADKEPSPRPADGPALDLWDGFRRYRQAERETDCAKKSRLILEGNERILAFEQRLLDAHLGVAFRITHRRVVSPMSRFSTNQRQWRQRKPRPQMLRVENRVARLGTWRVSYDLPGVPHKLRPIRRLSDGAVELHDCRIGFTGRARVRCWMCFDERMDWIVRVFHATHHNRWFNADLESGQIRLFRARRWRGFDRAAASYRQQYLSGSSRGIEQAAMTSDASLAINRAANDTPPEPVSVDHSGIASEQDWLAASEFYAANRAEVFSALMTRSLPATFCSPIGAPVLDPASVSAAHAQSPVTTKRLAGDSFPRVARTVQFVDEVFAGGSRRIAALAHARRRHSTVRDELGEWQLGVPINQEHVLATVTTFVCPVREVFDEFGFGPDRAPWDAWARVWAEIGIWLGLDEAYVRRELIPGGGPILYRDMLRVSRVLDVAKRSRNLAGVRLMDNLVGDLSDGYPRAARSLPLIALWALGDVEVLRTLLVPSNLRGRTARVFALWAANSNTAVRWLWRGIRHASARWILREISQADQLGPFDPLRFFPPDCTVVDLDSYEPADFAPMEMANLSDPV